MSAETVDRIGIGGGSPEGRNSAYLVDDRLVVDPGPPADDALADLRAGLERENVAIADLEYVLVTHWHVDHAGLGPRLADEADATLAMGAGDAPLVADYAAARERRLERDRGMMRRWGVPGEVADAVIENDSPSPMPKSVPVERLEEGDRIAGLEVVETPGHTLGHAAFAGDGFVLVGDAVLPTYTPNVGGSDTRTLAPREGEPASLGVGAGPDPLTAFLATLERLADRSERLLPGHGTAIESGRIDEIRTHQHERAERVSEALERRANATDSDRRGATPWHVAVELFGHLEGIHAKFGAGEVAAHCRRLERRGQVERIGDDPVEYEPIA